MLVYLIRHAESKAQTGEGNGPDTGLSKFGIVQAMQAGEDLQGFCPDCIMVSPLVRARQTLSELRLAPKKDLIMEPHIVENGTLSEDNPSERANAVIQKLFKYAVEGTYHSMLLVTHSMFMDTFLSVFLRCQPGVFSRVGNVRMGLLEFSADPSATRIMYGWNFSPRDVLHSYKGALM